MEAEDFLWDDFDAPNLESSQSKVGMAEAEAGPEIEGLASFHQLIYELNIWSYGLLRFPGYSRHIGIGETFQVDAVVSASLIPVCSVRDIVDMKETSTPTPGRIVAVKSLQTAFSYMNDAPSLNKGLLTKMILELRTLKLMSDYGCENVIKILGVAWRQEYSGAFTLIRPCLVVEYADIGTLTDFVKLTEDPRSEIVKMGFLGDIASALDCLLQNNIVHNDLKPDNVLIFQKEEGFTAKLSDFGHSIYLLGDWESCDRIIPGDETWASPELLMPVQRISPHLLPRVDVYSYGLLAWWLLIDGRNFLAASDNLEHTKTNSYESKISNQFEQLAIEDTYRLEKRGLADIAQSFRKIFRMSLPTLPEDRVSSYSAILDVTGPSTNNQRAEQMTSSLHKEPDNNSKSVNTENMFNFVVEDYYELRRLEPMILLKLTNDLQRIAAYIDYALSSPSSQGTVTPVETVANSPRLHTAACAAYHVANCYLLGLSPCFSAKDACRWNALAARAGLPEAKKRMKRLEEFSESFDGTSPLADKGRSEHGGGSSNRLRKDHVGEDVEEHATRHVNSKETGKEKETRLATSEVMAELKQGIFAAIFSFSPEIRSILDSDSPYSWYWPDGKLVDIKADLPRAKQFLHRVELLGADIWEKTRNVVHSVFRELRSAQVTRKLLQNLLVSLVMFSPIDVAKALFDEAFPLADMLDEAFYHGALCEAIKSSHNGVFDAVLDRVSSFRPLFDPEESCLHAVCYVDSAMSEYFVHAILDKAAEVGELALVRDRKCGPGGGASPLFTALYFGSFNVSRCLVDRGADVNETLGAPVLQNLPIISMLTVLGPISGSNRALELLLYPEDAQRRPLFVRGGDGWSPLHAAVTAACMPDETIRAYYLMMSHKFIMQKLQHSHHPVPSEILIDPEKLPIVKIGLNEHKTLELRHGALSMLLDIFNDPDEHLNLQDSEGYTALHYACVQNDLVGCQLLLSKDADSNVENARGLRCLDYAINNLTSSAWKTATADVTFHADAGKIVDLLLTKAARFGAWKIEDMLCCAIQCPFSQLTVIHQLKIILQATAMRFVPLSWWGSTREALDKMHHPQCPRVNEGKVEYDAKSIVAMIQALPREAPCFWNTTTGNLERFEGSKTGGWVREY